MPKKSPKSKVSRKKGAKSSRGAGELSRRDKVLREHLLYLLRGGGAHLGFEKGVVDLPAELRSARVPGSDLTAWRLLEHLRLAQWDILEFSRNPRHRSPKFPDGYWPQGDTPGSPEAWRESVERFRTDLKAIEALVKNPATDLFAAIPGGDGQTVLREALLVADHNAYHLGQLVMLRRLFGAWPE